MRAALVPLERFRDALALTTTKGLTRIHGHRAEGGKFEPTISTDDRAISRGSLMKRDEEEITNKGSTLGILQMVDCRIPDLSGTTNETSVGMSHGQLPSRLKEVVARDNDPKCEAEEQLLSQEEIPMDPDDISFGAIIDSNVHCTKYQQPVVVKSAAAAKHGEEVIVINEDAPDLSPLVIDDFVVDEGREEGEWEEEMEEGEGVGEVERGGEEREGREEGEEEEDGEFDKLLREGGKEFLESFTQFDEEEGVGKDSCEIVGVESACEVVGGKSGGAMCDGVGGDCVESAGAMCDEVDGEGAVCVSSEEEGEGGDVGEDPAIMKTVQELAGEANTADLFDPKILGTVLHVHACT